MREKVSVITVRSDEVIIVQRDSSATDAIIPGCDGPNPVRFLALSGMFVVDIMSWGTVAVGESIRSDCLDKVEIVGKGAQNDLKSGLHADEAFDLAVPLLSGHFAQSLRALILPEEIAATAFVLGIQQEDVL